MKVIPNNGVCLAINVLVSISILINKDAAIFKIEQKQSNAVLKKKLIVIEIVKKKKA